MQARNLVAKHARKFNKACVQVDRKKQEKTKPKNKYRGEDDVIKHR